jgi:hypothetical protein
MFKITSNSFPLMIILVLLVSCNKDIPKDAPHCIKSKIKDIKKADIKNPPGCVWQYTFEGKTVYYIPPYCCDIMGEVLDENCNLICHPDGGITGSGDDICPDFFTTRSNELLLWQDDRK